MSIYIGNNEIGSGKLTIGDDTINSVYVGSDLVWQSKLKTFQLVSYPSTFTNIIKLSNGNFVISYVHYVITSYKYRDSHIKIFDSNFNDLYGDIIVSDSTEGIYCQTINDNLNKIIVVGHKQEDNNYSVMTTYDYSGNQLYQNIGDFKIYHNNHESIIHSNGYMYVFDGKNSEKNNLVKFDLSNMQVDSVYDISVNLSNKQTISLFEIGNGNIFCSYGETKCNGVVFDVNNGTIISTNSIDSHRQSYVSKLSNGNIISKVDLDGSRNSFVIKIFDEQLVEVTGSTIFNNTYEKIRIIELPDNNIIVFFNGPNGDYNLYRILLDSDLNVIDGVKTIINTEVVRYLSKPVIVNQDTIAMSYINGLGITSPTKIGMFNFNGEVN